jgi:hypothetical protein
LAEIDDPNAWSLEFTLGYQAGYTRGIGIHGSAMRVHREHLANLEQALDNAIAMGANQVIHELDELILKGIQKRDTP